MAVANDDWPEAGSCYDGTAPLVELPSEISGEMGTPEDSDAFRIEVEEGDLVTVSGIVPDEAAYFILNPDALDMRGMTINATDNIEGGSQRLRPGLQGTVQYWVEESGIVCFRLSDNDNAEYPYEWQLNIASNTPEVATFEVTELRSRIDGLESQLQQKNQTINELESRISELEAQSSNGSGGDVTIQVTVTPANGQQNFVEGGEALVQAESENADVSEMSVEYGSGTYQLDSSGQVAIPLAQTGTQEMTVVYGDTTQQVSFEVQAQDGQNQQNQQNQQDRTPTDTSAPGFGIVVALIALVGGAFLLQRYRQS